jgi:hypothetical protein
VNDAAGACRSRAARRDASTAFAVALAARLAVVAWAHARFPAAEDGHYYDVLARRLASGAGYTWLWPDGAVTYVAHYPVGYPALLAAVYAVVGASAGAAMILNAVVGATAAYAIHRIVDEEGVARWRPAAAATVVALHPALVPYTAAVMTEGVSTALVVVGAALAAGARRSAGQRAAVALGACGVVLGLATLVRPQSILFAPLFGVLGAAPLAGWRSRALRAAGVTAIALSCVAPWTARNCVRMHRCAMVSVNGGTNLLIGATTTTGGWHPVPVPPECATVWDEAEKDVCFGAAARRVIAAAPFAWLGGARAKLAMTFDYFGAGPWYLHASAPEAFDEHDKVAVGAVEVLASRLLLLGALVACGVREGPRQPVRKAIAFVGVVAALTVQGWLGYLAIPFCTAAAGRKDLAGSASIVSFTAIVVVATAAVHAVFFGAGRYGLAVVPFVAGLAFAPPAAAPPAAARAS